eukprot:Amastigsp_a842561_41.p4 type:complete len:149 gc:universal Amastigsp_a842561_41:1117-671(-)
MCAKSSSVTRTPSRPRCASFSSSGTFTSSSCANSAMLSDASWQPQKRWRSTRSSSSSSRSCVRRRRRCLRARRRRQHSSSDPGRASSLADRVDIYDNGRTRGSPLRRHRAALRPHARSCDARCWRQRRASQCTSRPRPRAQSRRRGCH